MLGYSKNYLVLMLSEKENFFKAGFHFRPLYAVFLLSRQSIKHFFRGNLL